MRALLLLALAACETSTPRVDERCKCTATLVCDDGKYPISGTSCGEDNFVAGMADWLVKTHAVDGCKTWDVIDVECTSLFEQCFTSD